LNGSQSNEQAKALSERLVKEAGRNHRRQVELAYQLVANRPPSPQEMQIALQYLNGKSKEEEAAARDQFALAMFNINSFLYVK